MASLDPLFSIYDQVAEPAYYHRGLRGADPARAGEGAARPAVRIPSPERACGSFPTR